MLMILCSTAKLENDNKSENVKRGLRTRCEQGLRPCIAPTGYLNEKRKDKTCEVIVDPERAPIIKQMFEKVANEQWSGRRIYHWLKHEAEIQNDNRKISLALEHLHHPAKNLLLRRLRISRRIGKLVYGDTYAAHHERTVRPDAGATDAERDQKQDKEFAFTKLITCGLCGSGITACEKFKYQQNGNTHRYVYYGCTKKRRILNCKCGYIKEEEIIEQIVEIFDTLDINELGIKQKFKDEIARYNKFRRIALGKSREQSAEIGGVRCEILCHLSPDRGIDHGEAGVAVEPEESVDAQE